MNKNKTVGCAIIAKNESEIIGRCLESVKDADQIVVVDTGSTDNTIEIAKKYTEEVYSDFTWCDDFAKARNHVKSKMKTDWVLSIDCDEYVHDFSKVKEVIQIADQAVRVFMHQEGRGTNDNFKVPRLFKNSPDIHWEGAVHNHLSISGEGEPIGDVHITYGYSPAHEADPDRSLRILQKEVQDPTKCREMYYLGIELWKRKRFHEAVMWFSRHVMMTNHTAEKADSFLQMSKCLSAMGMDDDARQACWEAININPNFKEAVKWMGHISSPDLAGQWYEWAKTCDNRNVLFIRE
jgi:glycosyltransferase involved in cell wall biosynthesis